MIQIKDWLQLFALHDGVADPMPSGRENHKQQAADETNPNWDNTQNLLSLMFRHRIKAAQNILLPQSHRNKHEN